MREEVPPEHEVVSVQFEDETISLTWIVPDENDDDGGTLYQSVISEEGQKVSEEIAYWVKELRQASDELLAQWRRYRRSKK